MKIFLVVLAMLSSNIYAQKLIPNNVDLRAAYCISKANETVRLLTSVVGYLPTDPLDKLTERVHNDLAEEKNKLKRMQGYLIPRLEYLATEPLMIAVNQFKIDDDNMSKCQKRNQCNVGDANFDKCNAACKVSSGVGEKMGQCGNLAWLPY